MMKVFSCQTRLRYNKIWLYETFSEWLPEQSKHERAGLAGTALHAELLLPQQVWVHLVPWLAGVTVQCGVTQTTAPRWRDFTVRALSCDQTSSTEFADKLHIMSQEMLPNGIRCAQIQRQKGLLYVATCGQVSLDAMWHPTVHCLVGSHSFLSDICD